MSEGLEQIIDLILSKWENLLAITGGIGGLILLIWSYFKIICPLITAFIHKKFGIKKGITTIDSKVDKLQESQDNLVFKIGDYVFEKFKNELDKREEQKQVVYNQILGKTEDIKQEVTQITENVIEKAKDVTEQANSKKNEIIETIESKKQELSVTDSNKVNEVVEKIKDDVTKVVIINE